MVFPRGFLKVVASGPMLANSEEWSCSWSMDLGGFDSDGTDALLDDIVPVIQGWFSRQDSRISPNAQLTTVKANVLGTDGKYASDTYTGVRDFDPVPGGATGSQLPAQNTVAVSLLTARTRGPGSRGRFYPPLPVINLDANGTIGESLRLQMAGSAKALLDGLNSVSDLTVVVASEVGAGALVPVTRVAVGSVVDTQRRRRSSLTEVYSEAAVAP